MSSLYSLAYLGAVVTLLLAYARHYQVQKTKKLQNTAQFYEYDFPQMIYEEVTGTGTRNIKLEKASLLAWTSEAYSRVFKVDGNRAPMTTLGQNGLIGDELLKRFLGSDVLMKGEVQGFGEKSEKIQQGWSNILMPAAQQVAQNHALRKRLAQMDIFEEEYRSFAPKN